MKILIATIREWNINNFYKLKNILKEHQFFLITKPDILINKVQKIEPDLIFFPHWSWKIEKEIYKNYKSILFHMTDLPFGKGGSPLQNLIIREIYKTKITALEVGEKLDSGKIYMQQDIDISLGSAEEIFIKISNIIFFDMIPYLIKNIHNIIPRPQHGKEVIFKRRKETKSNLLTLEQPNLKKIYDFIRMLDAPEYPSAFIKLNNIKISFKEVHMKNNKLVGRFEIEEDTDNSSTS